MSTHTICHRPLQELMSLPVLSHGCGKRKPPYFPQTFEVGPRHHGDNQICLLSPFILFLFCFSGGKVDSQTLPDHLHGRSALGWSGGGGLLAAPPLAGDSRCYCSGNSSVKVLETVWKVQRRRGTLRALKLCVHTPGLLTALQINPFVPTPEEFSVMTEKKHTNSLLLETLAAF